MKIVSVAIISENIITKRVSLPDFTNFLYEYFYEYLAYFSLAVWLFIFSSRTH